MKGAATFVAAPTLRTPSTYLSIQYFMKNLKTVVSALLMVVFLATFAGCEKSGAHENGGQSGQSGQSGHGHSHE